MSKGLFKIVLFPQKKKSKKNKAHHKKVLTKKSKYDIICNVEGIIKKRS